MFKLLTNVAKGTVAMEAAKKIAELIDEVELLRARDETLRQECLAMRKERDEALQLSVDAVKLCKDFKSQLAEPYPVVQLEPLREVGL